MKKAIIIGATSGIGLEVMKVLTAKGWEVGIAGRRQQLLFEIQRQIITVDWRYRVLVAVWRLIPRWLWVRLTIRS